MRTTDDAMRFLRNAREDAQRAEDLDTEQAAFARAHRSQADYLAGLAWAIRDAEEALRCALAMRDWSGVHKYTAQIETYEARSLRASTTHRRRDRESRFWSAGNIFGRGRLPA